MSATTAIRDGGVVRLRRAISAPQFAALTFGCVVGVAWVVILGQLLGQAGPGGAALALALGALFMAPIVYAYARIAARLPGAGGEAVYAFEVWGAAGAFAIGATLTLIYVAACAFEAISLGIVFDMLFPGVEGRPLYVILGQPVSPGGLALGLGGVAVLWLVNWRGAGLSARALEVVTYIRLVLMFGFLAVAFALAKPSNLSPLFASASHETALVGFLGVLATTPFWYAGFNVSAQAVEERSANTSLARVGLAIVLGFAAAAAFYVLLVLCIGALLPWRTLVGMTLPPATALGIATGAPWTAKVVLLTALLGNLTAWNGLLIAGSRVLFALSRAKLLPNGLGTLDTRSGAPWVALGAVSLVAGAGVFLGKGFILPIVNTASAAFGVTYVATCWALLRTTREQASLQRMARMVARVGVGAGAFVAVVAMAQPYLAAPGTIPVEWIVVAVWIVLSVIAWAFTGRRRAELDPDERRACLVAPGD